MAPHVDSVSDHDNPEPDGFILVVDDEPANLSLLKETLSETGCKIRVVTSGSRTLEIIRQQQPALILLDVAMPGIDGFETCRLIKSNPATAYIPIIFATASTETSQKVKGFSLGAADYITKPFQVEEVLARVKVQLELRQLTVSLRTRNQQLEQEISARILAEENLQQTNSKLQKSLQELQETQVQLIQSEKMSSLGHLVAGIAHEINNPVNFIYGNLAHAKDYFQTLINLIHRYQTEYPQPSPTLQAYKHEIDLEFVEKDLAKLINSLHTGTERIRQTILALRNFSRLGESDMKTVDIHDGLESTLLILNSRLNSQPHRPAITIERRYDQLPLVECYPGLLNQVFMNVLANSIDAIEDRVQQPSEPMLGRIEIQTEVVSSNRVAIHIHDNGTGIPDAIQPKLFNPFFTTKPAGQGTGLGLSISHRIIVEKHGGQLSYQSVPGQGTRCTIDLPRQHFSKVTQPQLTLT